MNPLPLARDPWIRALMHHDEASVRRLLQKSPPRLPVPVSRAASVAVARALGSSAWSVRLTREGVDGWVLAQALALKAPPSVRSVAHRIARTLTERLAPLGWRSWPVLHHPNGSVATAILHYHGPQCIGRDSLLQHALNHGLLLGHPQAPTPETLCALIDAYRPHAIQPWGPTLPDWSLSEHLSSWMRAGASITGNGSDHPLMQAMHNGSRWGSHQSAMRHEVETTVQCLMEHGARAPADAPLALPQGAVPWGDWMAQQVALERARVWEAPWWEPLHQKWLLHEAMGVVAALPREPSTPSARRRL